MIHLVFLLSFSLLSLHRDPPVKLFACKQPLAKARVEYEMNMEGAVKTEKTNPSYVYFIWLATNHPEYTKIVNVRLNNQFVSFDTSHYSGQIKIEDGINAPMGGNDSRITQEKDASYIRIHLKGNRSTRIRKTETITIRFKQKSSCSKKIKKPIELLDTRITQ